MPTPLALVFDIVARDGASPVFNRVAVSADRASVATERATAASVGFSKTVKAAFVGLGVAAVGAEMVKTAVQFQKSMLLIRTQAGASAGEVRKMSGAVLDLAGKVGTAPQELAKSFYLVESAGYRGAEALKIQTAAAKEAKVGNADLTATTDALVATLQTGIVKGADAATKAVSQLNAIVGSGKMTMDDLNGALSTGILASAKSFGISLRSVGAALALMTDQGVPAQQAATRLRMAMSLLAAPTKKAVQYLRDTGVAAADAGKRVSAAQLLLQKAGVTSLQLASDLRKPDGFLVALKDLKSHMEAAGLSANEASALLSRAFGGGRSSGPIMQMLANLDLLHAKFVNEGKIASGFGKAWVATTHTASMAFDRIKAKVEAFGISVGTKLLPYVTKAANWLGTGLPRAFKALWAAIKPVAQGVGTALVGAFKLLEPLLRGAWAAVSGLGHLMASHVAVFKAFAFAATALFLAFKGYQFVVAAGLAIRTFALEVQSSLGVIGLVAAALGVVAGLFLTAGGNASKSSAEVQTFTDAIKADSGALAQNTRQAAANALQKAGAAEAARRFGIALPDVTAAALGNQGAIDRVNAALERFRKNYVGGEAAFKRAANQDPQIRAYNLLRSVIVGTNDEIKSGLQAYRDQAGLSRRAAAGTRALSGTMSATTGSSMSLVSGLHKVRGATDGVTSATHAFRDALAGVMGLLNRASNAIAFQQSLNDLAQTFRDNKGAIVGHSNAALADKAAFVDLGKQIQAQAQAMAKHGASVQKVNAYLRTHVGALREAARAGGADAGVVKRLSRILGLVPKRIRTRFDVDTKAAIGKVHALTDAFYGSVTAAERASAGITNAFFGSVTAAERGMTATTAGRGGIGDLLGTNGPTNPNASDSAAAARFPTTVPTDSAAAKAASKAKEKAKKAEAARKAALAKARQQAAAARSAAESTASGIISGIGQSASAQFQVGDIGINRVERQISAARAKIAALGHLRPADRARFAAQIESLVKLAQRQLDKLKVRIRTHDLAAFRKSLTGTAAEVRASFTAMLDDLRKAGASGGVLDRLRAREARLTAAVRRRNRDQARLDQLTASAKDLRNSVKSAVTGSFDVTQAGTNPRSGRVTGGSLLAQETQELNRIRKWGKDIKKLNHRGLNHAYLRQLASAGPSSLPQVEALLSLGDAAFTRFNRQEQQIQQAGTRIGRSVGGDIYGGRTGAARAAVREDRKRVHELAHAMALAIREELPHLSIKLDGRELNRNHHDHERRNSRHGGRS